MTVKGLQIVMACRLRWRQQQMEEDWVMPSPNRLQAKARLAWDGGAGQTSNAGATMNTVAGSVYRTCKWRRERKKRSSREEEVAGKKKRKRR